MPTHILANILNSQTPTRPLTHSKIGKVCWNAVNDELH